MFMNPTSDVFPAINRGSWNFRGENRIIVYLNAFKHFFYEGKELQGERDVTAMIYPPNLSAFVDKNN